MSKVYSFRLSDDNPREGQAREVIEARVREGYSLRQIVVEALIFYKQRDLGKNDLSSIVDELHFLILSLNKDPGRQLPSNSLSSSFLDAVKQSLRSGMMEK